MRITSLKSFFLLLMLHLVNSAYSQKIEGTWEGVLRTKAFNLPIVFNVAKVKGKLLATMDSPEQNSYDIPADSVGFMDSIFVFTQDRLKFRYEGKMAHKDTIYGVVTQGGRSLDLFIVRAPKTKKSKFLEEFVEKEVVISNRNAGVKLAGTLTYPKKGKNFPAVILISGSGPQDRDATLFGKKLFKTIAEHFTRSGYAVLRFDDRGVAKSTGNFATATSMDFATDVESIFEYLQKTKKIDKDKIGLCGHSEGSLIASIVASRNTNVAFVLSLAGPGLKGDSLLLRQSELIMQGSDLNDTIIGINLNLNRQIYKAVLDFDDSIQRDHQIRKVISETYLANPNYFDTSQASMKATMDVLASQANTSWFRTFLAYDPEIYWTKITCPVFAVNGLKDVQVPAVEDLMGIEKHLSKAQNYNVRTKMYPGLNHLFQTCETGMPSEYPTLSETFSGKVLNDLVLWMDNTLITVK